METENNELTGEELIDNDQAEETAVVDPVEAAPKEESKTNEGKDAKLIEEAGYVELLESDNGSPRRIKAIGITADVVNENNRRYPASVLRAAVDELRSHLHESAGQGRAVQLLGEAEHPSSKGGRPNILETVVKWEAVDFDGQHTLLEGAILPTSKGKDILALLEGGVKIPISQRGRGSTRKVEIKRQGGRRGYRAIHYRLRPGGGSQRPAGCHPRIYPRRGVKSGG